MNIRRLAFRLLQINLVIYACFLLTACSTAWTTEAVNIINVLEPAIIAALSIVSTFGIGVSPTVLLSIQQWGAEATNDLKNVIAPLIEKYNAAEANAQPGILQEIDTALGVVIGNLNLLLPTIHVSDSQTQLRIMAVINSIGSELTALLNLLPVIKGTVTSHDEVKARVNALLTAKEFEKHFNNAASVFGSAYIITK